MFAGLYDNSNAYWPGRRRPGVWKEVGQGFSDLATTTNSTQRRPNVDPATRDERAGMSANSKMKGAGSFMYQTSMRLEMPEQCSMATGRSEARSRFQGPGKDYVPRGLILTGAQSNFPKESHASNFKTTTKDHYDPTNVKQPVHGRFPAYSFADSGKVYTKEWDNDFKTTSQTMMQTRTGRQGCQESRAQRRAGQRATDRSAYNIINGSTSTMSNNAFEHYDARDYRRHFV